MELDPIYTSSKSISVWMVPELSDCHGNSCKWNVHIGEGKYFMITDEVTGWRVSSGKHFLIPPAGALCFK